MKAIVRPVTSYLVEEITLSRLSGNDRRCAVCHKWFDHADEIVVVAKTMFKDDSLLKGVGGESDPGVSVSVDEMTLVHLKGKESGSCLEDFVATLLTPKPEPAK